MKHCVITKSESGRYSVIAVRDGAIILPALYQSKLSYEVISFAEKYCEYEDWRQKKLGEMK